MAPVYYDCETTGLPPTCSITVACTRSGGKVRNWTSRDDSGAPTELTVETAEELARYLHTETNGGTDLVTFNGAKFDLQLLHNLVESPEVKQMVIDLTHNHLDLHLCCIMRLGYWTSMDSLAKGSLDGVTKTATGLDAVNWWKSGDVDKILEYCGADTGVLEQLHQKAQETNFLRRFPRRGGSRKTFDMTGALLPVSAVVAQKPHHEAWMKPNDNILTEPVAWIPVNPPTTKKAKKE